VHGDLAECAGLLVGDGDMGETIADYLRQAGLGALTVTARLPARAEMLAHRLGCNHAPLDEMPRLLVGADVVISALATGRRVLTREAVSAALAVRRRKPIFLIDVAVPGDIEPAVNELDGAFVYDVDDLETVANEGRAEREEAAAEAFAIVEQEVEAYSRERAGRQAAPAVARLRARFEAERAAALADAAGDAEKATRLLINRLLHDPSAALRALAEEKAADEQAAERLLDRLFGLGRDDGEENGR
jgi:glutamyl-tRNA reductase